MRGVATVPALGVLLVSMLGGCQASTPRAEASARVSSESAQTSCGVSKIASFVTPTTLFDDSAPFFEVEAVRFADDGAPHRCVVVEDLDGDGFVDLLRAQLPLAHAEGNPQLLVAWGPLARGAVSWGPVVTLAGDGAQDVPGACVASDVDRDGDLDVLVGGLGQVDLLENSGGRQFVLHNDVVDFPAEMNELSVAGLLVPLSFEAGNGPGTLVDLIVGTDSVLPCSAIEKHSQLTVEGGDLRWKIDLDWPKGLLVGLVGEAAYRWTPAPATKMPAPELGVWLSGALGDIDLDGHPELLFARDFDVNEVWEFSGGGRWIVERPSPIALPYNHGMGALIDDLDGDGCSEVYVSDFGLDQFYVSEGGTPLVSVERDEAVGVQAATARIISWGVVGADLDLNGLDDLFVVTSLVASNPDFRVERGSSDPCTPAPGTQWNLVLVQAAPRRFGAVPIPHDESTVPSVDPAGAASGDLDGDGDIDIVTLEQGLLRIHWNVAPRAGHWLEVRPLDELGVPCVGARVVVRAADGYERSRWLWGHYGTSGHSELLVHFGLGSEAGPVRIEVTWPDGSGTVLNDQPVDRLVVIRKSSR